MEASAEKAETQSSSGTTDTSRSDISTAPIEDSEATLTSKSSGITLDTKEPLGPGPGQVVEAETNTLENDAENEIKEVNDNGKAVKLDKDGSKEIKETKTALAEVESDRNESDSDDSDSYYVDAIRRRAVGALSSGSFFKAYTTKMERMAEGRKNKNQGATLVSGLVDYLRVLEGRIDHLEVNGTAKEKEEKKLSSDAAEAADTEFEIGFKFFDSARHLDENGAYLNVHEGVERGTYMSDTDAQHLIRALYSWVNEETARPKESLELECPNAKDIDILALGVLSEPIAAFFGKELDLDLDAYNTIRFEKPFRPIIRNISRVKEQLSKLENNYGRVDSIDESQRGLPSRPETPEAKINQGESTALPFSPSKNDEDDSIESFNRPGALPHFQSFVAFVDKYLGKQIQLFDRLREGREERVAFENLWMLFDSKDMIYCPFREAGQETYNNVEGSDHHPVQRYTPQAYRIVASAGGMPLARSMAPAPRAHVLGNSIDQRSLAVPPAGVERQVEINAISNLFTQLVPISRRVRNNYTELYVYCFYIDFNGIEYGTVRDVFVFKPYEREMDIRSLQAYPIIYATNDTLLDRGRIFLQMTRVSHMQYEGLTTGMNREGISSPVVVDVKLAFEGGPSTGKNAIEIPKFKSPSSLWLPGPYSEVYDIFGKPSCSHRWCYNRSCTTNVYMDSQKKIRDTTESEIKLLLEEYESEKQRGKKGLERFQHLMEDKDVLRLLPGAVPGFALRNRKWVLLDLNLLGKVEQNNEWKNLVLPRGHQKMVQAMVETHTTDLGSSKDGNKMGMDIVRGKGKGCIILLHGVPGVGKTSTAECVAAHTNKPLYPITCGDIGYQPEDVERNMENHFKLAHRWGCVLLLDEADVFLAKRDQRDVQRNGLVSVFLRILEYYSGILFLTTNRVGAIDDAFRSRLHLTLYYPKLTKAQTTQIFKQNFERIAEINVDRKENGLPPFDYEESRSKVIAWAKENWKALRWNGRQIRNTFQTVLALAEFAKRRDNDSKNPVVKKKHFKIVANASTQFNEYLQATHGYDEDRVAKRDFIRAVEYSPSASLAFNDLDDSFDSSSDDGDSSDSDDKDESGTEKDQDSSDDSDDKKKKKKKKRQKGKEEKSTKKTNKKGRVSEGKEKSEKKTKNKKKGAKEKEESDSSE